MSKESGAAATIDLSALRENTEEARRLAAGRQIIAVVKADAYGHGAPAVARALLEAGCGRLAVFNVAEAAQLREAGVDAPILVLGGVCSRGDAERSAALRLTVTIHHEESLALAAAAARQAGERLRVHVEVDTGMRRMGVPPEQAPAFLADVAGRDALELEGVFTHLACADDPEPDLTDCLNQVVRFREVLARARQRGVSPALIHADNSAALMAGGPLRQALPEANAVRPGLMLYGVRPAPHLSGSLRPVMTLRARVACVRRVLAGETVGYGATYRVSSPATRVATLAVGYADGIPCSAGNRGFVWLAGARRPIVGRVSMDSIGVDVGEAPVSVGDEAVIFGNPAEGGISVEEAAEYAATISYELLVRVGSRVPRQFVGLEA